MMMIWILAYLFVSLVVAAGLIRFEEEASPALVCGLAFLWPATLIALPLVFLAACFYGAALWLSRR